jgi:hypothetical protein
MGPTKHEEVGTLQANTARSVLILIILSGAIVLPLAVLPARAQSSSALAQKYAPELHFAKNEQFYPTSVDYIIGSSSLMQWNSGGQPTLVNSSPTPSNLGANTSSDLYLNNKLGDVSAIAADYASKGEPLGYFAYVHVVNEGASTVLQYWLFYAYNNGPLNDHQGDLEVIQVFLDSSGNPQTVLLSQHFSGLLDLVAFNSSAESP